MKMDRNMMSGVRKMENKKKVTYKFLGYDQKEIMIFGQPFRQ